jgi:hypothetical protein
MTLKAAAVVAAGALAAAGVVRTVIGWIDAVRDQRAYEGPVAGDALRAHALRADELAAVTELVLESERERGGDPATLRVLRKVAEGLGAQCGQLDELAHAIERGGCA